MAAVHCARLGLFSHDEVQLLSSVFLWTGGYGNRSSAFSSFLLLQILCQAQF